MRDNLLLAALPTEERRRLEPFLKLIEMDFEEVLIEPNEPIKNMFFPIDAVTSTLQEMSDGSVIETGLMGVEGVIGVQFWLRSPTTSSRTIIQIPGSGFQMTTENFAREVMNKPSPLNDLIARYTHAFLTMTSQTAACNRLHTIDERLCRWLKTTYDRLLRDEFPLRQDFVAQMLGVHRPTVSTAAGILQKGGLISYSRGNMKILDPEGLLNGSCECYEIINGQFDKIFDRPWRELARKNDENI